LRTLGREHPSRNLPVHDLHSGFWGNAVLQFHRARDATDFRWGEPNLQSPENGNASDHVRR
jgi:hypothetical protein